MIVRVLLLDVSDQFAVRYRAHVVPLSLERFLVLGHGKTRDLVDEGLVTISFLIHFLIQHFIESVLEVLLLDGASAFESLCGIALIFKDVRQWLRALKIEAIIDKRRYLWSLILHHGVGQTLLRKQRRCLLHLLILHLLLLSCRIEIV